ncbi:hypothetical protein KR032_011049 [Drosophila birchii]|nr:hypothetical protein KR032_011049 [Drosophila birchii]
MLPISSVKATLLALVIVTYVGPSASPPQDDEDYEAPDSVIPWNPERSHLIEFQELENPRDAGALLQPLEDHDLGKSDEYYHLLEDFHADPKMSTNQMHRDTYTDISREDTGQGFLNALNYLSLVEKANENHGNELDFKRMISFPWTKNRKAKPHEPITFKNQYCRISSPSTKRPACQGSTTDRRPSTTCPYSPKPTAPPRVCTPPPTPKAPPNRDQCSKNRKKPKFRPMNPKMTKILLKIIMDTKQHVLLALEILNHMENEVLTRSPDICRRQNSDFKTTVPKKKSEKSPKFSQCSDYPRKSPSIMALARQKQVKQKEHLVPTDSEENWCPVSAIQGTNRRGYKKYRNYGPKQQQPRMKKIPPGMVAILT